LKKSGFALESLQRSHPRSAFDCGQSEVNDWLRTKAFETQEKRISATKVLLDQVGGMAGFYTLPLVRSISQACRRNSLASCPAERCLWLSWHGWV